MFMAKNNCADCIRELDFLAGCSNSFSRISLLLEDVKSLLRAGNER